MCKFRNSIVLFLLVAVYANISFAYVADYQLDEQQQAQFVAGQVWSYQSRQHEQKSTLTILKVDYFENAVVVHVRLEDIKLKDPSVAQGFRTLMPHMAFLQSALQQSVIKILNTKIRLPEFSKEYQNWREGDGVGTAWAWHFSVSEALNGLEDIYGNQQQSSLIKNSKDSTKSNN